MVRLRRENAQLKQAMESRPLIDMARGVLMSRLGCSLEESWEILVEVSQHANVRVRRVSEVIVAAVTGKEPLPRGLRDHLVPAMSRRQVREHEPWEAG
ncbi:ANTAR domain-containing protein [Streptomyces sp. NPDC101209]|uniref:ANTAR domain-containing protein n=1 Tax=Streptomyces sp. NPDC101209 TaxID=3366129 RepID=UPI0037F80784